MQTTSQSIPQSSGQRMRVFPTAGGARFAGVEFGKLFAQIELLLRVRRERRQLRQLDPRLMKDLGLSQDMIEREGSRSFFDVPNNRKDHSW